MDKRDSSDNEAHFISLKHADIMPVNVHVKMSGFYPLLLQLLYPVLQRSCHLYAFSKSERGFLLMAIS